MSAALRVYLMADFEKGPRSCGQIADPARHGNPINWTDKQRHARETARAWWLVEAESADAARDVIALSAGQGIGENVYRAEGEPLGRILASGGSR